MQNFVHLRWYFEIKSPRQQPQPHRQHGSLAWKPFPLQVPNLTPAKAQGNYGPHTAGLGFTVFNVQKCRPMMPSKLVHKSNCSCICSLALLGLYPETLNPSALCAAGPRKAAVKTFKRVMISCIQACFLLSLRVCSLRGSLAQP